MSMQNIVEKVAYLSLKDGIRIMLFCTILILIIAILSSFVLYKEYLKEASKTKEDNLREKLKAGYKTFIIASSIKFAMLLLFGWMLVIFEAINPSRVIVIISLIVILSIFLLMTPILEIAASYIDEGISRKRE